jgi:hypothetical protein
MLENEEIEPMTTFSEVIKCLFDAADCILGNVNQLELAAAAGAWLAVAGSTLALRKAVAVALEAVNPLFCAVSQNPPFSVCVRRYK